MKKTITRIAIILAVIFNSLSAFGQNTIDFGYYADTYCAPAQLTIYDNSYIYTYQGTLVYNWYVDEINVANVQYPSAVPLTQGNHNIRLEVRDDISLLGAKSYSIFIGGKVTDFGIATGAEACVGQTVNFSIDNVNSATWNFGANSYFQPSTSSDYYTSYTYDKPGVYNVTLVVNDYCYNTDTVVKTITVSNIAKPNITAASISVQSGCINDPVNFSVIGNYKTYLWEFGDGTTSTLPTPSHTYKTASATDFTAKLTVTNDCGNSGFTNFPVSIKGGVPADAYFNYTFLYPEGSCIGAPIRFEPTGSGTYFWDFGDGTTSNDKNPVHRYGSSNEYNITLTVTNGCLNSSTYSQYLYVYSNSESYVPYPFFTFDISMRSTVGQTDTLYLCPGETAGFLNQTFEQTGIIYSWDFGDGSTYYGYNASHIYLSPGVFTVNLYATNSCGQYNNSTKYVKVDAGIIPDVALKFAPTTICAGDKIYFWDDNFDQKNNYTYSFIFGDGNTLNNVKNLSDVNLNTLATHAYAGVGPYNFTFKATNACGNVQPLNGVIAIDNNPSRKPFLYIENSTENQSYKDPEDWSVRHDPTDYEIDIPVTWPAWAAGYGTDFYIFLYYGSFDINATENQGYPSGIVHFNSASLVSGTTVKAYVPVNQIQPLTVGIAAGYYCGGTLRLGDTPDASGGLYQYGEVQVQSIPIIPAGISDLSTMNMSITIDPYYNGVCLSSKIEGDWYRLVEPGVYAVINFYSGEGTGYNLNYQDGVQSYSKSNSMESGYYYSEGSNNDTIHFSSYYGCTDYGDYQMLRPDGNTLTFIPYNEPCTDKGRSSYLSGTFTRVKYDPAASMSVCPGDKVQFKAAGGNSFNWTFGDGATSTAQFPVHAYAAPGIYNARLISATTCRQDTLYTKVTVMAKMPDQVYFWAPENEKTAGDSVHFTVDSYDNYSIDNHTYLWSFGDGTTSTLRNPAHLYKLAGNYNITLTATNGCGPAKTTQMITIRPKYSLCEAQFDYWYDGPAGFNDRSVGNPTAWSWDFGDGTYATDQNPEHYYDKDGVYMVTLTIYNDQTNCFSSVTNKVLIGWFPCQSDFDAVINTSSGLTSFISKSQNATDYYWDFGDGKYSTISDPTHTYTRTGVYHVCLTIWDSNDGCQSQTCKDVIFIPSDGSYINADYSFYTDPANLTVSFNDLSTQNATNWYWTMGDGKIMKTQNPVYTYSKPGNYKVCLTVYDKLNSLTNSICKDIRVGEIDCGTGTSFSYFINPVDNSISFFSTTAGTADNYFWTFGDGGSSTEENPIYQYSKPGIYKVNFSARSSSDNCTGRFTQSIQIGSVDCRAGFLVNVDPDNISANFKDNSQGMIDYYYWEFGDGSFSVDPNPDHSYKTTGNYKVSQTVFDFTNSCIDNIVQPVQVGEISCAADFVTYIDSENSTAYFTNNVLGESTALLWSFGDGQYSTQQNPVHEFPGEGIYSAALNTYNFNNGCMDYYQEKLLIGSLGVDCQADFIFNVDPSSSEVTFKDESIGDIVSSLWNFGDETENSTDTNPVHTYDKPGYYYVCLTVTNAEGTRNMGCKWVLVEESSTNPCHADFMYTVDSLSLKASFADNSFGDITKYTWDFGDNKADSVSYLKNPSHTYDQKGYYTVKLKVENSTTGCKSLAYKLLNVADAQVLKASFGYEAYEPNKKFAGYPVDLVSASSGDGATVEWDFGDKQIKKESFTVQDSTTGIVTHYYQLSGKYLVCLRISDPVSGQSDTHCEFVHTKFGVVVDPITDSDLKLDVYPNPFVDFTSINYSIPKSQFIEIAIFDQLGRRIETLEKTKKDSGTYQIIWQSKTVAPGIYHLKLITEGEIVTKQLVITK